MTGPATGSVARVPSGTPTGGQFASTDRAEAPVALDILPEPTPDQSYCDVGRCQQCSGYTEDEADAESCMHDCHDLPFTDGAPR